MRRSMVGLCFALACGVSPAQEFRSRPARIVVPWPPSGNVDITARTVAPAPVVQKLAAALHKALTVPSVREDFEKWQKVAHDGHISLE